MHQTREGDNTMVIVENHCVNCERCYHCGAKRVPIHYCDFCGTNISGIYDYIYKGEDGEELCEDCYRKQEQEEMDPEEDSEGTR